MFGPDFSTYGSNKLIRKGRAGSPLPAAHHTRRARDCAPYHRRKISFLVAILLLTFAFAARAHVGSPNVFFDGKVGDYPVRIIIRPPTVVPGVAEISIRIEGDGVRGVTALPVFWDAGKKGAPPPDEARLVRGETNLYTANLWLMRSGAYSVEVGIDGAHGSGKLNVPVNAVATNTRGMTRPYAAMLMALGLLLFAGAVRLVGAAFGQSLVPPGEPIGKMQRWRGRIAMTLAILLFAGGLYGGWIWWGFDEKEYRTKTLYRPTDFFAALGERTNQTVLELSAFESEQIDWNRHWTPLMPDHGKLMHLFLVREPDEHVFAHLHPVVRNMRGAEVKLPPVPEGKYNVFGFEVALPPLPSGHYQIYADVTHETGLAETLTASADLPAPSAKMLQFWSSNAMDQICGGDISQLARGIFPLPPDPDDSWHIDLSTTNRAETIGANRSAFVSGGWKMTWLDTGELVENREASLRFQLADTNGAPVFVEPYMGMYGHAVVHRNDGAVFAHIHPAGTFSMAAQEYFARDGNGKRGKSDTNLVAQTVIDHSHTNFVGTINEVSFPYAFPQPGAYRLWVQLKSGGRVYTGAFDADVKPAK
jgi:hypothetical protein